MTRRASRAVTSPRWMAVDSPHRRSGRRNGTLGTDATQAIGHNREQGSDAAIRRSQLRKSISRGSIVADGARRSAANLRNALWFEARAALFVSAASSKR